MKRTKLFIGLGAFALAIGGFLTTKANKKFAGVTSGKFYNGSVTKGQVSSMTAGFTTVSNTHTVILVTAVSKVKIATLVTTGSGNHKIYYTL